MENDARSSARWILLPAMGLPGVAVLRLVLRVTLRQHNDMLRASGVNHYRRSIHGTTKMIPNYRHLIEICEQDRQLTIVRVYEDGRKELFTAIELPAQSIDGNKDQFEEFCRLLGENLLLDSPKARKLLDL